MHPQPSTAPDARSFMLLTVHKAGSSYVGEIFKEIFARHGYDLFDPATEAYDRGMTLETLLAEQPHRFAAPRSFFGPFRDRFDAVATYFGDARPIIHLRDPRDCLVSLYYSLRYSHPVSAGQDGARLLVWRDRLVQTTIDGFVETFIDEGKMRDDGWPRVFAALDGIRRSSPDAILSRYEDMVEEFPDWLVGIVEQFGIEIDYDMIIDLISRTDFLRNLRVEENPYNHKRQITPGDFRRKLTPRSQALLTEFLAQELAWFGYV